MWAALWEPLLPLKMAGNGRVRRVLGTAGWIWRLAEWVYNTGYSHSEREREKHDSLTIKVRDGGRKIVMRLAHNTTVQKVIKTSHVILKAMNVGFPYSTRSFSNCLRSAVSPRLIHCPSS